MRDCLLISVAGRKKIGKTHKTMEYIRSYVRGNPEKGIPGRKFLIFDVNNEYSDKQKYPDIRRIALRDVNAFAARTTLPEIRRIAPFFDDNRKMTLDDMVVTLEWLVQVYAKGGLLVEDINKYITDSMPGDLIGAICTNRHNEIDILIHYQSFGRLSPKVWQNMNLMRFHKCQDSVDRHAKTKFPDKYEIMKIAETIVDTRYKSGDQRFYLWVDFDDDRIIPAPEYPLKESEVRAAVFDFISQNNRQVLGPMLEKIDRNGKKLYNHQTAIVAAEQKYLEEFFGIKD